MRNKFNWGNLEGWFVWRESVGTRDLPFPALPDEEYLDSKALWPLEHQKGGEGQKAAPLGQIIQIWLESPVYCIDTALASQTQSYAGLDPRFHPKLIFILDPSSCEARFRQGIPPIMRRQQLHPVEEMGRESRMMWLDTSGVHEQRIGSSSEADSEVWELVFWRKRASLLSLRRIFRNGGRKGEQKSEQMSPIYAITSF